MPNFSDDPDAFGGQDTPVPEDVPLTDARLRQIARDRQRQMLMAQQSVQSAQNTRMDEMLQQMAAAEQEAVQSAQAQFSIKTEVRTRFAKAALYEQIIGGQLFEGDDDVTLAVEAEFKDFAEERLMALLGIQPEKKKAESLLEEDEVSVLKMFAAKLLGRPASIPRPTAETKSATLAPVRAAPVQAPIVTGVLAAPKRGRGRPPGTGKHQRAAAAALAPDPLRAQAEAIHAQRLARARAQAAEPQAMLPPVALPEEAVRLLPNGQIAPPSSSKRVITGATKPVPMPSPEEMVAKAMMDGEAAAAGVRIGGSTAASVITSSHLTNQ